MTGQEVAVGPRRSRRPIVASRYIGAPIDQILRFLGDLENHVQLAPGSVELLSLDRRPGAGARALVRLKGPLGIERTATTELVATQVANSIAGRARVGSGTLVSVAWIVHPRGTGSAVTLCATLGATRPLDALLLRLGGRRWLARRFAAALDHLCDQLAATPGRVQARPAATASAAPQPARRAA